MFQGDTCRPCDGHGHIYKRDMFNRILSEKLCSKCNGTGKVNPPGRGRRFFKPEEDEMDPGQNIEQMTRAFLKKHGR